MILCFQPRDTPVKVRRSNQKKEYDEAAKYYDRASSKSETNPNNAEYLVSAARCFASSSQTSKAIELYKRVVYEFAGTNSEETARHALAELHYEL